MTKGPAFIASAGPVSFESMAGVLGKPCTMSAMISHPSDGCLTLSLEACCFI